MTATELPGHEGTGRAVPACVAEFLAAATALGSVAAAASPEEQAAVGRELSDRLFREFGELGPEVAEVRDLRVPVDGGEIEVRLYRGSVGRPLPLHLVLHGGGWQTGSLHELVVDATCRERAAAVDCVVAAVDYRLAPEHPFPTPLEDCYAALSSLLAAADELGLEPDGASVGGGSAGGNLAAALALLCRDRGGPELAFQLLEVPALDLDADGLPEWLFDDALDLSRDTLRAAAVAYAGAHRLDTALLSPLCAPDLTGVAPAHIMTAGRDPLRLQGQLYAQRLEEAGVPVTLRCHDGALHGSGFLTGRWEVARQWRDEVLQVLQQVHGKRR